jgi:hypothetical protein
MPWIVENRTRPSVRGRRAGAGRSYAAVADIPGNSFAGPAGFMEWRGGAKLVNRTAAAEDMNVARRLWDASEQLTGVRFPLTTDAPATNPTRRVART